MPFDNTAQTLLLDDTGKLKYDLRTGKGRLLYLADQLLARRPADFNMASWDHCAIGEARRMPSLVAAGLPPAHNRVLAAGPPVGGFEGLAAFFQVTPEAAISLFGSGAGTRGRTSLTESRLLRKVAKAMT